MFYRSIHLRITLRNICPTLGEGYDVNGWKLPLPLWAKRGYDAGGIEAWESLQQSLAANNELKPLCIYAHLPFCASKCGFCDSYSFAVNPLKEVGHIEGYTRRLDYEMNLWADTGYLRCRPVSTVHLGGGTPPFLGEEHLSQLVYSFHNLFNITSQTEWALESNVSSLSPVMLETLHRLGFRRLHIGVQSLQDPVRKAIGRRSPGRAVLAAIARTLSLGWVVSVDLICGLPGQTIASLGEDVQTLIQAGVDGFSLYELLIYPQNLKWAQHFDLTRRSHIPNYLEFQCGANLLENHGYRKNIFNHWSNARDLNTYFTFPQRGEDLLALGAMADGVFGDYHYRHPGYAEYLFRAVGGKPGLEGGLKRSPSESSAYPFVQAVLSGTIPKRLADLLRSLRLRNQVSLVDQWLSHALVTEEPSGRLSLTTNGSLFAGNMVDDVGAGLEGQA